MDQQLKTERDHCPNELLTEESYSPECVAVNITDPREIPLSDEPYTRGPYYFDLPLHLFFLSIFLFCFWSFSSKIMILDYLLYTSSVEDGMEQLGTVVGTLT